MEEKKERKCSQSKIDASIKWQKENYVRIPFDVRPEKRDEIKNYAAQSGKTVGGFIKEAIDYYMEQFPL